MKNTFAIAAVAALMLAACAGRADAEESKAAKIEAGAKAPDFSGPASRAAPSG